MSGEGSVSPNLSSSSEGERADQAVSRVKRKSVGSELSELSETGNWSQTDWSWDAFQMRASFNKEDKRKALTREIPPVPAAATGRLLRAKSTAQRISAEPERELPLKGVCQVEGCSQDLSKLKDYHNRYRICEFHLKLPSLVRNGVVQRFCQQCGRFHDLTAFDSGKRSCRARLERHNARRRKVKENDGPKSAKASAKKDKQTKASRKSVETDDKAEDVEGREDSGEWPAAPASGMGPPQPSLEALQDMLLHDREDPRDQESGGLLGLTRANPMGLDDVLMDHESGGLSSGKRPMSEDDRQPIQSQSRARLMRPRAQIGAVSGLLSDYSGSLSSGQSERFTAPQRPLLEARLPGATAEAIGQVPSLQGLSAAQIFQLSNAQLKQLVDMQAKQIEAEQRQQRDEQMRRVAVEQLQKLAQMHDMPQEMPHEMAHFQPEHPSGMMAMGGSGALRQLERPAAGYLGGAAFPDNLISDDLDYPDLRYAAGLTAPRYEAPQQSVFDQTASFQVNPTGGTASHFEMSPLEEAHRYMAFDACQAIYAAEEKMSRMSAKLFNCTPEHLPEDLRENLVGLLSCGANAIEGYIRPGCVHLTLNAMLPAAQFSDFESLGVREAVERLVAGGCREFWAADTMLIQLHDEVALVRDGRVLHVLSGAGSSGVFPKVYSVLPLAICNADPDNLVISGTSLLGADNSVICRCQGMYVPVRVIPSERVDEQAGAAPVEEVHLQVQGGFRSGTLLVEVVRGAFISPAKPVLMVGSKEVVAEVRQLEGNAAGMSAADVEAFLLDVGRVLEFGNALDAIAAGSQEPTRTYTDADVAAVARTARRVLMFATVRGWPAVAELALSVAAADMEGAAELVEALDAMAGPNLTFLHAAVRSQNTELVEVLLEWACTEDYKFKIDAPGPRGVTPLHLAALIPDNGDMADLLTEKDLGGVNPEAWHTAKAADGQSPSDFAAACGNTATSSLLELKIEEGCWDEESDEESEMEDSLLLEDEQEASKEAPLAPMEMEIDAVTPISGPATSEAGTSGTGMAGCAPVACNCCGLDEACSSRVAQACAALENLIDAEEDLPKMEASAAKNVRKGGSFQDYDHAEFSATVSPTAFDRGSAVVLSVVIALIGMVTLPLRYSIDSFLDV